MLFYLNSTVSGLTIYTQGGDTIGVPLNSPHYKDVLKELENANEHSEQTIRKILFQKQQKVKDFSGVDFEIIAGELLFRGKPYENEVFTRMLFESIEKGCKPGPLIRFLEKLEQNPNVESREMVWRWLSNQGLAIDESGDIVGFKYVTKVTETSHPELFKAGADFTDGYTGTMRIKLGEPVEMPRSKVTFNENECHSGGLHVGIFSYARYSTHSLICKVNPADIVSVPKTQFCKVRCCRYTPVRELTQAEKDGSTEIIGANGFTIPSLDIKDIAPEYSSKENSSEAGWLDNQTADHWNV